MRGVVSPGRDFTIKERSILGNFDGRILKVLVFM